MVSIFIIHIDPLHGNNTLYDSHNHAVSDGVIIGTSVVCAFMVIVFLMNMVSFGVIKFRKYCTNVKFKKNQR